MEKRFIILKHSLVSGRLILSRVTHHPLCSPRGFPRAHLGRVCSARARTLWRALARAWRSSYCYTAHQGKVPDPPCASKLGQCRTNICGETKGQSKWSVSLVGWKLNSQTGLGQEKFIITVKYVEKKSPRKEKKDFIFGRLLQTAPFSFASYFKRFEHDIRGKKPKSNFHRDILIKWT